ncbi:YfeC-like transcriptional regulator [Pseudescherichia sp.]|uniref:YfeC-like transcriptional regulator n=1 Tax=Pseudescherichia sp. TaxID=2055881 RepID=UPI00289AE784|nr:YfeC-like transcriptional regulator [Pseudescherichia sp.]
MKLPDKMTPEEMADYLGVARQTVNRWIREQNWQTETLTGVKGGRARLILIDERVLAYMRKTPVVRHRQSAWSMAEPSADYSTLFQTASLRQISNVLQNMTPAEQERLERFLAREGLRGFLTRLGIADTEQA